MNSQFHTNSTPSCIREFHNIKRKRKLGVGGGRGNRLITVSIIVGSFGEKAYLVGSNPAKACCIDYGDSVLRDFHCFVSHR